MIKKSGVLLIIAVMVVSLLAACTADKPTVSEGTGHTDTFDTIMRRGTFKVGLIDQPPTSSKDPNTGEWSGFGPDLAQLLAEPLGVELEIVEVGWDNFIAMLQSGKIDFALPGMWSTPQRAMSIWFTRTYRLAGTGLVFNVADVDRFRSLDDVNKEGVVIAVAVGTATVDVLLDRFPNATIREVSGANRFQELAAGNVDIAAADWMTCAMYASNHDWAMVFPEQPFSAVPISGGVRRGDIHLLKYIDATFEFYEARGIMQDLINKYYMPTEITD